MEREPNPDAGRLRGARLEALPVVLYTAQAAGEFGTTWVSDRIEDVTGFLPRRFVDEPSLWASRLHPDDRERVLEAFGSLEAGGSLVLEYRWQRADGTYAWVEDRAALVGDGAGCPVEIVGTWIDVTSRHVTTALLQAIVEHHPDCIKLLSEDGVVLDMNPAGLALNEADHREEIIGRSMYELVVPEHRQRLEDLVRESFAGMASEGEVEIQGLRGTRSRHHLRQVPLLEPGGRVVASLGIARDVTERKLADEALRMGRHLLSEAQRIAHIGSWSWDLSPASPIVWTDETYRLYGVSAVDFVPSIERFATLIHPEDRHSMQRWIEACAEGGGPGQLEFRAVHPSGEVRVLSGRGHLERDADGHPLRIVGTVQDVTERRRSEDLLREARDRLRALSARLVTVQEDERRSLARELHDHLGQLLTGLKLSIEMARRLPGDRRDGALEEAAQLAGEVLGEVRRLAIDLRPSVLDDLGLLAALVWHVERFTSQTGVRIALSHAGLDRRLPTLVETTAFRIAQEALANVARHAGVDEAALSIARAEGLRMEVSDRGAGFDVAEALARRASAGLSGMQERAALAGGRLAIEASPGAGCRIVLELPLETTA